MDLKPKYETNMSYLIRLPYYGILHVFSYLNGRQASGVVIFLNQGQHILLNHKSSNFNYEK